MDDLYTIEVDLHGMTVVEARNHLIARLNKLPSHIREVRVIHGYNQGTNLQKVVRKEFKHKTIERKILELNQGITTFLIK